MNRQIYTYTDLRTLGGCSYWSELREYPQITVSADLQKSLKGTWEKDRVRGLFSHDAALQVREFRKLSEVVLADWGKDETKFCEMIILAEFIRNRLEECQEEQKRYWLIGCRRNLGKILSAIIQLEEAGIEPEDLEEVGDRNTGLLKEAWKYLREKDPYIAKFHKRMKILETRNAWDAVLLQLFGMCDTDAIVFHGFYYFTPLQERLMRLMEKAGIRLLYLFPYDDRYPYAYEIWQKTYSEQNGYPNRNHWHMEKDFELEPYGEIFEGRKCRITNKLKVQEYPTVTDFVQGMKRVKEAGYFIYSPNNSKANDLLRDFYPEEYGERKLLSYPIGQFVNILNNMWDEDKQRILLDEDKLIECFGSGWLAVEGISGKQYMQDLVRIMPFFGNCSRIEEWQERIELLRQIAAEVIEPFRKNLSMDEEIARWQEVMGNPFHNFGVFSVSYEKLDIILKLIEQLISMARELFAEKRTVQVQEHIRKLDRILRKHEISNELYAEERELIQELFDKLGDTAGFNAEVQPADISSALNLFMNGRFTYDEIQTNKIGMVSPIYMVDAASVKQRGRIHICLCDVDSMPGRKKEYPWPLTSRHIRNCYEKTGNPLLVNMMHVTDTAGICNRYFMYSALKNDDVQISWIHDMGEKFMAPSPYVKLICEAAGIGLTPVYQKWISKKYVEELPEGQPRIQKYERERMPRGTAKEAKMDYALCPMKYALGYVVEEAPVFASEFHQKYAVNGLIAAMNSLMRSRGMELEEIYRNVISLFPFIRPAEKRQIYDYLRLENSFLDADFSEQSEAEDMKYTEERLKISFPNRDVREQAMEGFRKWKQPDGKNGMDLYRTAADTETAIYKKKKVDVCLFCQHQSYCRYAFFVVDQEALYD